VNDFDVLLTTVHLSVILAINQLNAQNLFFFYDGWKKQPKHVGELCMTFKMFLTK